VSPIHSLAATLLVLAPTLARAAEETGAHGGEHGSSFPFWHAVNLALIVGVIVYFARNPIRAFMADRRSGIEHGIESAQRELTAAQQRLAECNQRLATLDREIEEIRRSVREQTEGERTRLLADARAAAERIRRDAAIAVEQEGRSAREKLRAEVAELAVRLAGDVLERQVGDADQRRLVDDFVGSIEARPRQS
jgi:F-type H+-transporting ATPase subunit b